MKENTTLIGYAKTNKTIKWFWEILEEYDHNKRQLFLKFVTGSPKVPLGGFANLKGHENIELFKINKVVMNSPDSLPCAHTWYI